MFTELSLHLHSRKHNCRSRHIFSLDIILLYIGVYIIGCAAVPENKYHNDFHNNFATEYGAPLITPLLEEVTVEVNSNYTIRCEANEPVFWKFDNALFLKYEIKEFDTNDPERPYGSMLYLTDITHDYVSSYVCIKNSSTKLSDDVQQLDDKIIELINNNQASSIYLYVNDQINLLAPVPIPIVDAKQFQDVVIPCKPTSPQVDVLLTTPGGETFSSENTGRYDPRRGFVIVIRAVTDGGDYICRPKIPSPDQEDEQTEFTVQFYGNDDINPYTKFINKPTIISDSYGHGIEGENFTLICQVNIAHDVRYTTEWETPKGIDKDRKIVSSSILDLKLYRGRSNLTITNAKKSDSGIYRCKVTDHGKNSAQNTFTMTILQKGESYINISEPNNYYTITSSANQTIQMNVKYRGYPWPSLRWAKPDGTEISNTHKYEITTTDSSITLKIMKTELLDSGIYTLNASNGVITKQLQFRVNIKDSPIVNVDDIYVRAGELASLTCKVTSFPAANVSWTFTPCKITPRWPSCDRRYNQKLKSEPARFGNATIEYFYDVHFIPTQPGIIHCEANNSIVNAASAHVLIGDINENITIYGIDEDTKIARDDDITLTCASLAYYFKDISWYKDGELITTSNDSDIEVETSATEYSYKKVLHFKTQDKHSGTYECRAAYSNSPAIESRTINIFVHEPNAPKLIYTNMIPDTKLSKKLYQSLELICESEALPLASVYWYKDGIMLNSENGTNSTNTYSIPILKPDDKGLYTCVVSNRVGQVEASVMVEITDLPVLQTGWIALISLLVIMLIAVCIYLGIRILRERKLLRELKAAGLANFEEGAVAQINPALSLDEQADLLPYDRGFEFPRDKLKLGKQLGAGAFGVVLKAHAEGIKPDEKETVVAVKMVKRTADNEVVKALVSELKIMVHLGQHLNVVNLLGACTKNIAKRELMVIVEYCRFGNLQNLLLRNRKSFINQINPLTQKIDPTITQRFSDNLDYAQNTDNDPRSGTRAGRPNSSGYMRRSDLYEGHVDSCATEQTVMTTIPDDENVLSNNSVQPGWRSNYKPDSTESMTFTTSDLCSWAFQIARGMDYLCSKKVLHGDLAARNILLSDDNVVKICDFGLARSMYRNDNYKKQGEAPLPLKWLALESLTDHIFNKYTDVWSYGIVLWELFSLAKVPYPGMHPNQSLYVKLRDGYRMEKPPFANDAIYEIMLECWSTNPESRPLFNVLEKRFGRMLGDEVTNHYVDLNEEYLRFNTEYMKRNPTDYLALMGSPDEMAPPPPRYVNGHILPEIRIDSSDDYLQMSTNSGTAIFSPTRPKDYENSGNENDPNNTISTTSFTFPDAAVQQHSPTLANNMDNPINKNRKKEGVTPEEIPMLQNANHNSDGEHSPEQLRKFSNVPTPSPRHNIVETQLNGDDNYVNVKSPKAALYNNGARTPDAFSNPSYQVLKTGNDGNKK
ncbi:vascular endothelial growth factor receptor kdr-like isoform X2 [Teleopsis dalmanni]|uniref:vascular endothelial growth factor receptor kdr-like isoform X2 n=1 Tax=Teleopsis dalmanni TaxID=139649 RepID=UPI0018CD8B37|nr:vascular endothelial growth factor receptor kdr-like isoform X2 [Teleopsis dalmanni]